MKRSIVIALALCSLTIGCPHKQEDTESAAVWLRPADMTPATSQWQPSAIPAGCNDVVGRAEATQMLRAQPICTDAAVSMLEGFSRTDPTALNDLAAAYVLRAQREDRPADLLNALDAAQHAVNALPQSRVARFNRAMIEETLGLPDDALDSWNQFLKLNPPTHTTEAHVHRDQLLHRIDPTTQWDRNRAHLGAALRAHDRQLIERLIKPFPSSAEKYLEEELLTREHFDEAKTLAAELARLSADRYLLDVLAVPEHSPESQQAHLAYSEARRADRAFEKNRGEQYLNAIRLLENVGSPLSLLARLGYAGVASLDKTPLTRERAFLSLDLIEKEARAHSYTHILARTRAMRANFLRQEGRYVESLAESDGALSEYERINDFEDAADTRARRIGTFRTAGQNDLAWRDAMETIRAGSHMAEMRTRHVFLGDTAQTALALGHASIALQYQNTAVRLIQRELVNTPPEQPRLIEGLQSQLSIVLRARASIELRLERYSRAAADLNESIRLNRKGIDPNVGRTLQARLDEMQGQSVLRLNPARSVVAFSTALAATSTGYRTYRASLLAERADAQRRAGRPDAAEKDLRDALEHLRAEQLYMLEHRKRGQAEEMWSSYFSRFGEASQTLIRQLTDAGRTEEAFDVAEKARAFEPLYLVSEVVPKEFDGTTKTLAEIQQSLPVGTQLIEYSVLPDQTIVWLVSREGFSTVRLAEGKAIIERHASDLQRAANARNLIAFEDELRALYRVLMAKPLAARGAKPKRLFIVPDGPMHGLPFAALRDPLTHRYLIQEAAIEIAGSANLYLVSLARDKALQSSKSPSVLLVGDPAFDENLAFAQGLHPLPRARSECETIHEIYGPQSQMLLERDATIPRFLEAARASTIIHVAAHSIVNAQAPSRSYILLAPAAKEPGPLEAQALLTRLSLDHTRLVVLSTCSSAGGLPVGAEGVAPFVRPLIGAGVPAVIGTLWNVDDATAEELLVSFHRHYREGNDAAIALQLAQIGLLMNNNKPGLRSVLAWAPFQVIGHGSSPFAPAPPHKEKPP